MNRLSLYRWPERLKSLYKKYFSTSSPITYENLFSLTEDAFSSHWVEETDEIPTNSIQGGEEK